MQAQALLLLAWGAALAAGDYISQVQFSQLNCAGTPTVTLAMYPGCSSAGAGPTGGAYTQVKCTNASYGVQQVFYGIGSTGCTGTPTISNPLPMRWGCDRLENTLTQCVTVPGGGGFVPPPSGLVVSAYLGSCPIPRGSVPISFYMSPTDTCLEFPRDGASGRVSCSSGSAGPATYTTSRYSLPGCQGAVTSTTNTTACSAAPGAPGQAADETPQDTRYKIQGGHRCGVHARQRRSQRQPLPQGRSLADAHALAHAAPRAQRHPNPHVAPCSQRLSHADAHWRRPRRVCHADTHPHWRRPRHARAHVHPDASAPTPTPTPAPPPLPPPRPTLRERAEVGFEYCSD